MRDQQNTQTQHSSISTNTILLLNFSGMSQKFRRRDEEEPTEVQPPQQSDVEQGQSGHGPGNTTVGTGTHGIGGDGEGSSTTTTSATVSSNSNPGTMFLAVDGIDWPNTSAVSVSAVSTSIAGMSTTSSVYHATDLESNAPYDQSPASSSAATPQMLPQHEAFMSKMNDLVGDDEDAVTQQKDRGTIFCQQIDGTWTNTQYNGSRDHVPKGRFGHTACVHEDRMYIFGGRDTTFYNDVWSLPLDGSMEAAQWRLEAPLGNPPRPRAGHTSVVVGDQMFIFGGGDDQYVLRDVWALDLSACKRGMPPTWSHHDPPEDITVRLHARKGHTTSFRPGKCKNGQLIVYGGMLSNTRPMADSRVWTYDIFHHTWSADTATGDIPPPRMYHIAELDAATDKLYLFGGRLVAPNHQYPFLGDLFQYHVASGVWRKLDADVTGPVPPPRMCAASLFHNGSLLVMQGGSFEYLNDCYEFDVRTKKWLRLEDCDQGRTRPTVVFHKNTLIQFAGCLPQQYLNDTKVLKLRPPRLFDACRNWILEALGDPKDIELQSSNGSKGALEVSTSERPGGHPGAMITPGRFILHQRYHARMQQQQEASQDQHALRAERVRHLKETCAFFPADLPEAVLSRVLRH